MRALLDTRFFAAHFLAENEETKSNTRKILEDLQKGGNVGFVPTVVVHELYKFEMENFGRDIADIRVNVILRLNLKTVQCKSMLLSILVRTELIYPYEYPAYISLRRILKTYRGNVLR